MKYLITLPALCVVLLLTACLHAPGVRAADYPVVTTLAGMPVETTVDSPLAARLLAGNWPADTGEPLPPAPCSDGGVPDTQRMALLSQEYSPDTAMALLLQCLLQVPKIRYAQSLFISELDRQRRRDRRQAEYVRSRTEDHVLLFVPGWDYQSNSDRTGADMAGPRARIAALGFETHLVPIEGTGSVEDNARILADSLRAHLAAGSRILLVSASSGGPTVLAALTEPDLAHNPNIRGWLNICGVLQGSPVLDYFAPWPRSLFLRLVALVEGWDYDNLLSLSQARNRDYFSNFTPPPRLTIVNYIGAAFSGQVSSLGRQFYGLMEDAGPNDGLTPITDALAPGYTVIAMGTDHFIMEDPEIDLKTAALLPLVFKLMERDEDLARAAAGPPLATTAGPAATRSRVPARPR